MRQTTLVLKDEDRETVKNIIGKGRHGARELSRAYILSGLDRNASEEELSRVLSISRTTIWRTRKTYMEEGLASALFDGKSSGKPSQYGDDVVAMVTALACSKPPEGRARWTVRLLAEEVGKNLPGGQISRETVRRALKKTAP
ncbi:MAG: helix-turn-helix domain-containing protein [Deltaproteobacteria bacterium]|jgi:transposase|nr:helix-turn-helix domain-containing protein [Deltaproteobacteria bacterium]